MFTFYGVARCFWLTALTASLQALCAYEAITPLVQARASSSTASGSSSCPRFSRNTEHVIFTSTADDLVLNDTNGLADVFLFSRLTGTIELISVNFSGSRSGTGSSFAAAVSEEGRYVAFESDANDLAPDDTNGCMDVFVRDRLTGGTHLISKAVGGGSAGGPSYSPIMTPDGRWIAFESRAENLVTNDANGELDIFVHDLTSGVTVIGTMDWENKGSSSKLLLESPALSDDGRYLAFRTRGTNTHPEAIYPELIVRDLQARTNLLIKYDGWPKGLKHWPIWTLTPGKPSIVGVANTYSKDPISRVDLPSLEYTALTTNRASDSITASQDGGAAAFVGQLGPGDVQVLAGRVYLWSPNFSAANSLSNLFSRQPALSLDGSMLSYCGFSREYRLETHERIWHVYVTPAGSTNSQWITRPRVAGGTDGDSSNPQLSADGRWLVFESDSSALFENDMNQASDVFLCDTRTGDLSLISRRHLTAQANALSPSFLGDGCVDDLGQRLVFTAWADGLESGDANRASDVYFMNLVANTQRLISRNASGNGAGPSALPVLSGDGTRAAFTILGNTFAQGATGRTANIFYWNAESGDAQKITRSLDGTDASGHSTLPTISRDGGRIAFQSLATNLVDSPDTNGWWDIFLYDSSDNKIQLISSSTNGGAAQTHSWNPVLSPSGRRVAFLSAAPDLGPPPPEKVEAHLFLKDLSTGAITRISEAPVLTEMESISHRFSADERAVVYCAEIEGSSAVVHFDLSLGQNRLVQTNARNPVLSADGKVIAYATYPDLAAGKPAEIYCMDLTTGSKELISVALSTGSQANGDSFSPALSADGSLVLFHSQAENLVSDDGNGLTDIILRDRRAGTTLLLSRTALGKASNGRSASVRLNATGTIAIFQSFASNLGSGAARAGGELYVLRLTTDDHDQDGLDDDWEMQCFGNLLQTAEADPDHDGASNAQEFKAQTDPNNTQSVFKTYKLTAVGSGKTTVFWFAVPGKSYQIEFTDDLRNVAWTALGPVRMATSSSEFIDDPDPGAAHRFYRARLVSP